MPTATRSGVRPTSAIAKSLSFPYRRPRPHPYPCYNRPPQPTIAPWGNGVFMLKGKCVQFVPKI
ncbi:hypothetical protein [Nostoc sp. FACHB-888]|uniref:hypothetical protein n=1 Tax=Nostoc sp. FACHB-888 TaxID=2692842 RepID=UPI00168A0B61|nr:hypothetical protein [Nostoc sp. FACHB-888]MBD2249327.1 hypothetical protein [Nostoc sp. FACHB-888]